MKADYKKAAQYLSSKDEHLGAIIDVIGILEPTTQKDPFKALVTSILSQQLSSKASSTIQGRLEDLIDNKYVPAHLAQFSQEELRSVGVSRQKFGYIHDLCQRFIAEPDFFNNLDDKEDAEILEQLTQVKGIGVWTAQMFLMFSLGRLDVFAPDDVGLQNALRKIHNLEGKVAKKVWITLAEPWMPYRSVASRYLWRGLDEGLL